MRLASFEVATDVGPARRVGVVEDDGTDGNPRYVDVTAGYGASLAAEGRQSPAALAATEAPTDMQSFLERGGSAMDAARRAREFVAFDADERGPGGARCWYDADEVRLLSPVPRPNTLRDCMAYEEHVKNSLGGEVPDVWYELPVYYKGNPESVVHPGEEVEWPSYTESLDYELELAAVVGREGRDLDAEEASDYIAGYTVFNDFSARDIQGKEMQGRLGPTKGKDFANGFGPYLVTADAVDIASITLTAEVNGETWSEGTPGEMYHTFPELLAYISRHETLYPGDVVGSGTVGRGCGLELGRWLEPGDTVRLGAEEIGKLEHTVVRPE
ncbi:fumarylacetoacetate hydrolase family protein [Halomarina rubra]|uniref:Fumarylacetoacetate hydrolase family protein n=1 Tax=Halomarina rubra TaxID=2071873 RepID=A0ABD6AWP5_9EURY|nr:fumarylacetoacetate hydrolase family protein [Halomarina rubra]